MDRETQKKLLETVRINYEEIAFSFNQTRKKGIWPELTKLAEEVKDGDRILDIGCGNGRLLEAFRDKKIDYIGVDFSKNLIKKAKDNYPENNFFVGNMLDLGKISELNFNYVFSVATLHHLPSKNLRIQALKQMRNKIKKDGKIVITNWNLWEKEWSRKLIFKFFLLKIFGKHKMDFGDILFDWKAEKDKGYSQRYYHAFRKRELKKIARKAGLKMEKIYKDKHNYYLILKK
ncbi:class I SAM-dependent methyltransferase [bacterium]|nr:class I SAM-dependent methyltransferase [bacterium]